MKAEKATETETDRTELAVEVPDFVTDRYASLKLIPWWEQERVAAARVMVVGAGALGNEVLKNLALVGVGYIFVIDFDTIESSNLTRSVLFRAGDIGQPKAKVAAERVREMNPDVKVAFHCGDITTNIGLGAFRRMDVVIGCVDNVEARVFVNRACWKVGKPWINGGIDEMQGIVDIFVPPDSSCYECTMTDIDYQEMNRRHPCGLPLDEIATGKVPTTPTIASMIAAIQVQEALKLIHGKEVEAGVGIAFYGTTNQCLRISYPKSPDCLVHSPLGPVVALDWQVAATTFGELLEEARQRLGNGAAIDLDFDLVVRLSCGCGRSQELLRRRDTLTRNDLTCTQCGEIMVMDMTSAVDGKKQQLLHKSLAEGGIRPLEIITVRDGNSQIHLELAGDEDQLLEFG